MCKDNGVPFVDFNVLVGPIESLFGVGVQGGFMDETLFKRNDIEIPCQITKDIRIYPPVIFVNAVQYSSYPEQTEVLIHEYRHFIYNIVNPNYKIGYSIPRGADYKAWSRYLADPNERAAHKSEIRFELQLGKSVDEIIRKKVGGVITSDNYPIALKFSELVDEVAEELERKEEDEELIGTS
jgi:hypothetical protein